MRYLLNTLFLICACNLQAQVWTNLIDSVPQQGWAVFSNAVVDSNTNNLYIGGQFFRFNQYNTNSIIKYNGSTFDTLQSGIDDQEYNNSTVTSMVMFQNKLYVAGAFKKTGKYWCKNIGRWNGTSWDTINFKPNNVITKMEVYNNELYVAGDFDTIGGIVCHGIAKYNGTNWFSLNHPQGLGINDIKYFKGKLYKAGMVTPSSSSANLSYFDGTNWIPWVGVSGDANKGIYGMTVIDTMLFVYGRFNSIANTNCKGLVAFNGSRWFAIGNGLSNSAWETIRNVQKINGDIYITGHYNNIEGISTGTVNGQIQMYTNIVKFDGQKLCATSPPFNNDITGVIGYNNNLYTYGAFRKIGNDSVWGFVKWNGGNSTIVCSSTIAITPSIIGLNEIINFSNIKIYPNPVKDKLKIEFTDFEQTNIKIQIINYTGQLIETLNTITLKNEIDFSTYANGIYFLKLQNQTQQKVIKIIKE